MMFRYSLSLLVAAALFGWTGGFCARAQTTTPSGPGAAASDTGLGGAIDEKLVLSPAQRTAIYDQVSKDKSKVAPKSFSPVVGSDVPPMIELYTLPDDAVAAIPAAKIYKYTMVDNKVVLVDPTRMRVVDVIGPPPSH
jgi:hypothetical protein